MKRCPKCWEYAVETRPGAYKFGVCQGCGHVVIDVTVKETNDPRDFLERDAFRVIPGKEG